MLSLCTSVWNWVRSGHVRSVAVLHAEICQGVYHNERKLVTGVSVEGRAPGEGSGSQAEAGSLLAKS